MSKKTQQTQTAQVVAPVENVQPVEEVVAAVVDPILQAYLDAEKVAVARTTIAGRNVPFSEIKPIVDGLRKQLPKVEVAVAKVVVTDVLTAKYKALPTGMDRMSVRIGTEMHEMTKTEFKELRLAQLAFSVKENNIYRMIYQIINKGRKN